MRKFFLALAATLAFAPLAAHSDGPVLQESSFWAQEVNAGSLPHVQDRIPSEPLVVDLEAKGRSFGRQGGTCLLYTSPSPRDLSTSRMPSSA